MRSVDEWIGATPDTPIPPRVRLRVWDRAGGRCEGSCGHRKIMTGERWDVDHKVALVNGGQHRESNLQVLCAWCHAEKTRADVKEKSTVRRKRAKHVGIKKQSSFRGWRKFDGTPVRNPRAV